MKLIGPARFKVTYTADQKSILCEKGTAKFSGLMTSEKPKLYIFFRDRKPIYIGATVQSMAARMRLGWKADGKGGFYGYRFRHEGSDVELDVWVDRPVSYQ